MSVGPFGPGGSVVTLANGASMSVEAAFAQFAPAGGSVMSFAPGASMTTEAAFAGYAPAGGSLGLNAANGCSIGVEAAFANALQSGLFNGSSLGVEAAFSSVAPVGGSVNLPGFLGFDGSSLAVEAAFLEHGFRNPSGASCMTGAGASMAVEGAFSEFAPPLGLSIVTSAAPDAPFTNGVVEDNATPRLLADIAMPPPVLPSRQAPPSVPRRLAAPPASQTQPDFVRAQPPVVRQRQGENASFRSAAPPPVFQYNPPAVRSAISSAQTDGSFNEVATGRSLQPPFTAEALSYPQMYPTSNIRQEAIARDGPAFTERVSSIPTQFDRYAHSYTGPGIAGSVVRDMPSYIPRPATSQGLSVQHYLSEGDRLSYIPRPATSQGLSVQHYLSEGDRLSYIPRPATSQGLSVQHYLSEGDRLSYIPRPATSPGLSVQHYMGEGPGDVLSYIPRPVTGQGLSLQQMPAQGLSLQFAPPSSGVAYPAPVPQRNPNLLSSPFASQAPITIESTPTMFQPGATSPSMARAPQRGNSSNLQPYGMQYFNGNTARYAAPMQPMAPAASFLNAPAIGSTMPSMSPSPFQIPTASYIKPSFIPNQVPSFTAPVMGANQVPSYTSPQLPQTLTGQMPLQYARPVVAMPMY